MKDKLDEDALIVDLENPGFMWCLVALCGSDEDSPQVDLFRDYRALLLYIERILGAENARLLLECGSVLAKVDGKDVRFVVRKRLPMSYDAMNG